MLVFQSATYDDEKVQTGKEYEYRVIAVNEAGEGEPSSVSVPVPAKPEKEKPKFDRDGLNNGVKEIKVKAGEPLEVIIPIVGAPTPTVTWIKDGKPIPPANR